MQGWFTLSFLTTPIIVMVFLCQISFWQMLQIVLLQGLRISNGTALQTVDQRKWSSMVRMAEDRASSFGQACHARGFKMSLRSLSDGTFRAVVDLAALINVGTSLSASDDLSGEAQQILIIIDIVCLSLYFFESAVLLSAYLWDFFFSFQNVFDLTMNVVLLVDLLFTILKLDGAGLNAQAIRAVRAVRIIRLGRRIQGVVQFANCLDASAEPAVGPFFMLLTILFAGLEANQIFFGVKQGVLIQTGVQL